MLSSRCIISKYDKGLRFTAHNRLGYVDKGLRYFAYNRLGYVLYVDGTYQIYVFDFDSESFGISSKIQIRPNLFIPKALGLGLLRFCCVGSILYAFPVTRSNLIDVDEQKLFKIDLSRHVSDYMLGGVEDMDGMLEKVSSGLSHKCSPIPLRWGQKIVVFSSLILFQDRLKYTVWGQRQIIDFEIFCPFQNQSIPLPPLLVRPGHRFYMNFQFFNTSSSKWESFLISPLRSYSSSSEFYFTIDSYGLDRDTLLIQADFGATFCLDLNRGRDAQWELLTPPLFTSTGQTFLVENDNGKMWVDAYGITVGQARQHIKYPPLSSPCTCRGYTLLNHPTPVIVRLGLNTPRAEVGYEVVADELRWCIDALIVEGEGEGEEKGEDEEECESGRVNFKMMVPRSSWKFGLRDQDVMRAEIVDVFSIG